MIYTLTISPSIDYINKVDGFKLNKINRSNHSLFILGGKGINVSLILKELNIESTVLGFKANFTGEYLEYLLKEATLNYQLIPAEGFTRINVKILSDTETALNTNTLIINDNHINELKKILRTLNKEDILIISGNIPSTIDENLYEIVLNEIDKDIKVVIDAEKNLLLNAIKYKPFLIKPNREELEQIFASKIKNKNDAFEYAYKLKQMGAQNVIVSLDSAGAILLDSNNNEYYVKNVEGKLISSVGAGDSLVAGFIGGVVKKYSMKESFMLGVACANATAYSERLANRSSINQILQLLKETNFNENN